MHYDRHRQSKCGLQGRPKKQHHPKFVAWDASFVMNFINAIYQMHYFLIFYTSLDNEQPKTRIESMTQIRVFLESSVYTQST